MNIAWVVAFVHWGCSGAGDKWVESLNEPANIVVAARYVTRSKSVKIYTKGDNKRLVKMSFLMSDKLPRVSTSRMQIHMKKMDFATWLTNDRDAWLATVGETLSKDSHECPALSSKFVINTPEGEVDKEHQTTIFSQSTDGILALRIGDPNLETPLALFRFDPPKNAKPEDAKCITAFKSEEHLRAVSDRLMQLRLDLIDTLAKEAGFDGAQVGTRLSRVKEPKEATLAVEAPVDGPKSDVPEAQN